MPHHTKMHDMNKFVWMRLLLIPVVFEIVQASVGVLTAARGLLWLCLALQCWTEPCIGKNDTYPGTEATIQYIAIFCRTLGT